MKQLFIILAGALLTFSGFSAAWAGNAENGKTLFESPTFGGGTSGKTCTSCHAAGEKLSADLFERETHSVMGKKMGSVADIVNMCIKMPLKGKGIKTDSKKMKDILAYMQSLIKGKTLFESPTFGGGTSGKTCASCHAGGAKLSADLFERDKHMVMGKEMASVADISNSRTPLKC
uniref:c-type cytochrome n=1 Tax=Candidatus Electrothrix sp. TaxID=2170559 RepID=UPI004057046D